MRHRIRSAITRHRVKRALASVSLTALAQFCEPALADQRAADVPAPAQAAQAEGSTLAPSKGNAPSIETVTVTARRRSEKAQDVPIALSVIGGTQIDATGADNVRSLYLQVPSLNVDAHNPRNTAMTIRGVGATIANDALVNSVAVFVDGVYMARPGASTFGLIDIEQIETLRGPQGTLFGKNTTAGALNITSRKPTQDRELNVEASVGNFGFYKLGATASGGVTDDISLRVSGSTSHHDGYLYNTLTKKDVNTFDDKNVRGQVLWQPRDDISFRLIADYAYFNLSCCSPVVVGVAPAYDNGAVNPSNFFARAARIGYTPLPINPAARQVDDDARVHQRSDQYGVSGEANWTILDGHTLTAISAYRRWFWTPANDSDSTGAPVLGALGSFSQSYQVSQELRLASPTGRRFEYVVGGYYFDEKVYSYTVTTLATGFGGWLFPTVPATVTGPAFTGITGFTQDQVNTDSKAGFAQGTYHVTPALSVTAGLRYTSETKTGFSNSLPAEGGVPLASVPAALRPTVTALRAGVVVTYDTRTTVGFPQSYAEGKLSGTGSVSYRLSDTMTAYGTYARGYKSGGLNFTNLPVGVPAVIQPEATDNFEVGLKSTLLDRRLVLNLAAFDTEIKNFQSALLKINPQTGAGSQYVSNAPKARSRGFELDAEARVTDAFRLQMAAAYADAKFVRNPGAYCLYANAANTCDLSGTRLPNSSKLSGSVGVNYDFPDALWRFNASDWRAFANASLSYRSKTLGQTSINTISPGYAVANIAFGIRSDDQRSEASLWVRNVADKTYYTTKNVEGFGAGTILGYLGDPRTVGVTIRQRF